MTEAPTDRSGALLMAAFIGHLVLALWFVETVTVNGDEGWYLYAAHRVAEGAQLHRDLAFFQAPVMPQVYGGMTSPGPGSLLAGRWLSLLFVLMSTGLTALAAQRMGGRWGAALALVLVGLHPLVVSAGVWVKPYALATMLLAGGLFLVAGTEARKTRTMLGALLMALAVGTRLTLLPVLFAALWCLPHRRWAALGVVSGLVLGFRAVWGVPLDVLGFQWVGFHLGGHTPVDWMEWLGQRLGFLWNGGLAFGAVLGVLSISWGRGGDRTPVERLAAWALPGVILLHLLPRETHVEHWVIAAPLMGVLVGARAPHLPQRWWTWPLVVALVVLGSLSGMRWVQLDAGESSLDQVQELGVWMSERTPSDAPILTFETVLAVESDRRVPPGFEMGRFGWRPDMEPAAVTRLGLLDGVGVTAALGQSIGGIAVGPSDYAGADAAQSAVHEALLRLPSRRTEAAYGQFGTPLALGAGEDRTVWVPMGAP